MKTILVADDDEIMVYALILRLKQRYTVEYVDDGRKALERIEKGGLDGAVLDWEMIPAGMRGTETAPYYGNQIAKKARELQPNLALILNSSIATEFIEELKPFDVYCNKKSAFDSTENISNYLQQKLGE